MADRKMVSVDAEALRTVLQALIGPPHHIRELQMTRSIAALTGDDPIGLLVDDFKAALNARAPSAPGDRVQEGER